MPHGAAHRIGRLLVMAGFIGLVAQMIASPVADAGQYPLPLDDLGFAVSVSGNTAVVGADGVNNGAGAAYIYARQAGRWRLQAVLTDPRDQSFDDFGAAVAVSGGTVLVGAPDVNNLTGMVYVFTRSGTRWHRQAALSDPGVAFGGQFGFAVSLSGTNALINAVNSVNGKSAVYLYSRSGSRWRLRATLSDPVGKAADGFGAALAISGATALISAPGKNHAAGVVYVYVWSGTHWTTQAVLGDPRKRPQDAFGGEVAIDGTTAIVGRADDADLHGTAYIYARSGTTWRRQATLNHGPFVAVSGSTAVVGDTSIFPAGAAYVYGRSASRWHHLATLKDPQGVNGNNYGQAVAASGSTVIVGANGDNNSAGAAYIYRQSGPRWRREFTATDAFGQQGNFAGVAVAISGPYAVVGAPGTTDGAGAAYVDHRSGGVWHRQAVLTDPGQVEGNPGDAFGVSAAVSGTTVMIGASDAKDGDGAVYIYVRGRGRWRWKGTLTHLGNHTTNAFGSAVAMSGTTAVIGADQVSTGGAAYVYARSAAGRWLRQATLPDPSHVGDGVFGESAAVAGSHAIVGATGVGNGAGAAYIYARIGTRWHLRAALPDPAGVANDNDGISVAISSTTAVVGASGTRRNAGAAYIYVRSGARWHLQKVLTSPVGVPGAGFGYSVAISGSGPKTRILVGGASVSGLPTGKNQCGRVFEFTRSRHGWHERARVADPQCLSFDEYGYSVALAGQTAVIGVPGANHNAGVAYVQPLP